MKRWYAIILLLPCILLAQEQPAVPVAAGLFTVSLPRSVKPETVQIDYGFYGPGLSIMPVVTRAGVFDYPLDPRALEMESPTSLKLVIYIPGYRVVTAEFTRTDLQAGKVFIPPLVPLATTTVKGRLLDSAGNPMPDESIRIGYMLDEEMSYFGYADGIVRTIRIAEARTDGNGEFAAAVPALFDDPFFQRGGSHGRFILENDKGPGLDKTLDPASFPIQKTYEPLTIRKTRKGTLSGKLGAQFLRQNNLSPDLRVYARPREPKLTRFEVHAITGRTADTGPQFFGGLFYVDGTFELQVPAGKYDIELWASAEDRHIQIGRDVVIEENGQSTLERP